MSLKCPRCGCPGVHKALQTYTHEISYRGRRRTMLRRRRECRHCGRQFQCREFVEDTEPGPPSPVNPLFTSEFLDPEPTSTPAPPIPAAASSPHNPYL